MKLIKFDDEYFLVDEGVATSTGDYMWTGTAVIKIIRAEETRRGNQVVATSDHSIEDLPKIDRTQIEKPIPTAFQPTDLIAYSNWVLQWCSTNKYRKTTEGVKPFGTGEEYSDTQLFQMYLDSLKVVKTEWNDVEFDMQGNNIIITNL